MLKHHISQMTNDCNHESRIYRSFIGLRLFLRLLIEVIRIVLKHTNADFIRVLVVVTFSPALIESMEI